MKRLNRKRIIEDFETLRQGFADAIWNSKLHNDACAIASFRAYHKLANMMVVELGGDKVDTP